MGYVLAEWVATTWFVLWWLRLLPELVFCRWRLIPRCRVPFVSNLSKGQSEGVVGNRSSIARSVAIGRHMIRRPFFLRHGLMRHVSSGEFFRPSCFQEFHEQFLDVG